MKRKIKKNGFLLLEVILSVLIISSGIMVIVRAYSNSLKSTAIADAATKACFILEDRLFDLDIRGFRDGVTQSQAQGGAVEGEKDYVCNVNIQSPPASDDKVKMSCINLNLVYTKGSQSRMLTVSTVLKFKEG